MKILHTGDLHVGKKIKGRSRAEEHRDVLAEIETIAQEEEVDIAIIAGDLFDRSAPTPESEDIVYSALVGLSKCCKQVVVVAGNHDNPDRLKAIKHLLNPTRICIATHIAQPDDGGVVQFKSDTGETAQISLLPFISQRAIVKANDLMNLDADEHAGKYSDYLQRIIGRLTQPLQTDTINLIVSHLSVIGGRLGGGERTLHTLLDYCIPSQAFPSNAHYVALGHFHAPQDVPGPCPIRYCGSPLQLDFGDDNPERSVSLIQAEAGLPAHVEHIPLNKGRRLRTLTGTLDALEAERDSVSDDYLRLRLDEKPTPALADHAKELFPHAVEISLPRRDDTAQPSDPERDVDDSPVALFGKYLEKTDQKNAAVHDLFKNLMEEVHAPDLT